MSDHHSCPDGGCIALKHVLEAVVDTKDATRQLVDGQHQLDKTLAVLNENVIDLKSLGKRVGNVEKNQWKLLGVYSAIVPIATGMILHFIK